MVLLESSLQQRNVVAVTLSTDGDGKKSLYILKFDRWFQRSFTRFQNGVKNFRNEALFFSFGTSFAPLFSKNYLSSLPCFNFPLLYWKFGQILLLNQSSFSLPRHARAVALGFRLSTLAILGSFWKRASGLVVEFCEALERLVLVVFVDLLSGVLEIWVGGGGCGSGRWVVVL